MSAISFPQRHLVGLGRPFTTPSEARTSESWLPRYGHFRKGALQPYSVVWAGSRRGSVHNVATMAMISSINDEKTSQLDYSHIVAQNLVFARFIYMAVQTVLKLGIPDILANAEGRKPMSAEEILRQLPTKYTPGPNSVQNLQRLLGPLVRQGLFSESLEGDELPVYGLTEVSQWFISENPLSITPMSDMLNSPLLVPAELLLPDAILDDTSSAFTKLSGLANAYELPQPEFRSLFQKAMENNSKLFFKGALESLVLDGVNTLVDVGGSTGYFVSQVVANNPHIQGINFDLQHVIDTAPEVNGVQHVAGSFFESVPSGDAMFLKWIIHNYGDEDAIQILKNCWKALPAKNGKVVMAEFLKDKHDDSTRGLYVEALDLIMLTYLKGGRERSKEEYQELLVAAGFPRCNVIETPDGMALIEGFKE